MQNVQTGVLDRGPQIRVLSRHWSCLDRRDLVAAGDGFQDRLNEHGGGGKRITYLRDVGGISEDWPRQVFDEAVRSRILTTKGEVVRQR